jgi:methylthioribose-1-phosphate isomerase
MAMNVGMRTGGPDQVRDTIRAVEWRDDRVRLLDQRLLPHEIHHVDAASVDEVTAAIRDMVVRGAPAIGIAAAYGVVLAARAAYREQGMRWRDGMEARLAALRAARPTAVNLSWAVETMRSEFAAVAGDPFEPLLARAQAIHDDDVCANRRIGELGAGRVSGGVLTHCNAGSLATGGFGTALGVVRTASAQGRIRAVFATETRPWLQGARLTAWELAQDGIPATLLADSAAAALMQSGAVQWVIVGADRIAANGDVANKIGTYALAALARSHGIRFMVAAPVSTIDAATATGADIPIEMRGADEIRQLAGRPVAAADVNAWNPVFDVTPAQLVDVLVTERGLIDVPDRRKIAALLQSGPAV